jgi:hypothetical protein
MLDFGKSEANARKAVQIIKENGFQYQCFVGRPNAPMMYFRKDSSTATAAASEECTAIRPEKVKLKLRSGQWAIVDGDKTILDFKGDMVSALAALKIIQHYQFNAQCFIGRGDGGMQYFKSKKGVPSGSYLAEDALEFDPNLLELKLVEGQWKISQGEVFLLNFGAAEENARLALDTIKRNGFRYQCFVGRPNAPMIYFRK